MAWTERYVDASAAGGGTGTSAGDPWTLSEAISNSAAGMRVNIKAGSYPLTGTNTVAPSTTSLSQLYWRGYKTIPGDLDGSLTSSPVDSTDIPFIESSYRLLFSSSYINLTGLSFANTSASQPVVFFTGNYFRLRNCRFRNENSAFSNALVNINTRDHHRFVNCEFGIAGTTTTSFISGTDVGQTFESCYFYSDIQLTASQGTAVDRGRHTVFNRCLFKNLGVGIRGFTSGVNYTVINCTFDQIADDAIRIAQDSIAFVAGNYFRNIGGFAVGNYTGTTSADLSANLFAVRNVYNNVGGQIENAVDDSQFLAETESGDEYVDSAGGDYTLKASSVGYGYDPGHRVGIGSRSYADMGAFQHEPSTGGGNVIVIED